MTIRSNTDLGRRAETNLATITATSNFILFHAGHRKLGMSNRNRDNLLVGESRKRVQEIIADKLSASGSGIVTPAKNLAWPIAFLTPTSTSGRIANRTNCARAIRPKTILATRNPVTA